MIYVLGSINHDISLEVEHVPKRGETLSADGCITGLGGKGANQAVAIAKLGRHEDGKSPVKLIAKVGSDAVGDELVYKLNEYNVDTEFVGRVNRATGTAVIMVSKKDNRIVSYTGANGGLCKTDVDEALEHATEADTLLCQLEVPMYVVSYALRKARAIGMTTILNPSPVKSLPEDIYYCVDIMVLNRLEAQMITGVNPVNFEAQKTAMRKIQALGVPCVVITLGDKGSVISDGARIIAKVPAVKTTVEDTTGAGDAFVGALTTAYPHVGMYSFKEACLYATRAASIAVSRSGSANSLPTAAEVDGLYVHEIE